MIDILDRVRNKALHAKIVSAQEAAELIKPGMNVGTSGFTPSGYPKAVPLALAERMKEHPFKINLYTGASVGPELDGALCEVNGIDKRIVKIAIPIKRYTHALIAKCVTYYLTHPKNER